MKFNSYVIIALSLLLFNRALAENKLSLSDEKFIESLNNSMDSLSRASHQVIYLLKKIELGENLTGALSVFDDGSDDFPRENEPIMLAYYYKQFPIKKWIKKCCKMHAKVMNRILSNNPNQNMCRQLFIIKDSLQKFLLDLLKFQYICYYAQENSGVPPSTQFITQIARSFNYFLNQEKIKN
jgi:hypothetical protein